MSRIQLNDSLKSVVTKMSDGNPGAVSAMVKMLEDGKTIDPQGIMGGLGAILILDTFGIYGTDIYILYNDKCGRDVRRMLMLLRAVQLGFFSETKLKEMAGDQMRPVNLTDIEWEDLDTKVCDTLKDFKKAA